MIIAVAGIGYVGLSNAILLSQHNKVYAVDVDREKVQLINSKKSPIAENLIWEYLSTKDLDLTATLDGELAYRDADYVIVAVPTNYDAKRNYFDTSAVEQVIEQVHSVNKGATIVIKSTVPIGYTRLVCKKFHMDNILFSPEFLREGLALYDNLYPSRIVLGVNQESHEVMKEKARAYANLQLEGAIKKDVEVLYVNTTEAEAVKLFANTYLAMRVAFFNELDTYAEVKGLDASVIIKGMSLDPRIGNQYNNPSFGYGGYCLPKDTKQMVANYQDIPNDVIKAIVNSNQTRKAFVVDRVLKKAGYPQKRDITIGAYRLVMKTISDNFRESAIQGVIENLLNQGIDVIIYEPTWHEDNYDGVPVINDFEKFCEMSTVIIANRYSKQLDCVREKVYTRDIFREN